jgi:predicted DNA-binding protein (MmcQ/YjbR family)
MGWICILNPSKEGFNDIKDFIDESYNLVLKKFEKKKF